MLPFISIMISSCKKQDQWLEAKNRNSDIMPSTLADFQAMLDANTLFNGQGATIGLTATDNIIISDANLDAGNQVTRNAYLWEREIYNGELATDWAGQYRVIGNANIVLDGLTKLGGQENSAEFKNVKGSALFYRAFAFYQLCQLYCKAYNSPSSQTDLGIPLRMTSDVNIKVQRSTVEEAYQQILNDLTMAAAMLPEVPLYKTRPSSLSTYALLAKVYLSMRQYNAALRYSDQALQKFNALLDYNNLSITANNPFPTFAKGNPEILFYAVAYGLTAVIGTPAATARVNPELYGSYEANDLRRTALYTADAATGTYRFKGPYSATPYLFCGLATNELYLIRAECLARQGDVEGGLADLNKLLQNRYTRSGFQPVNIRDNNTLIDRILLERRKEMPYNGNLRWDDLKRLNLEPNYQRMLTRTYKGGQYRLPPNDNRYVFPIPDDEIQLQNLVQNPR